MYKYVVGFIFLLTGWIYSCQSYCGGYLSKDGMCIEMEPGIPFLSLQRLEEPLEYYAEHLPDYKPELNSTRIKSAYFRINLKFVADLIPYNGSFVHGLAWEDRLFMDIKVSWVDSNNCMSKTALFHELNHAMDLILLHRWDTDDPVYWNGVQEMSEDYFQIETIEYGWCQ